jgi:hypothetical protein
MRRPSITFAAASPGTATGRAPGQAALSGGVGSRLAFGMWLAARGGLATASLVLAGGGALASVAAAMALRDGRGASLLPGVASSALAWGAGSTLAFGAALHALRHDRQQGVIALARTRGMSAGAYVQARVGGLVALLAAAVGGGTLVAVMAATAVARSPWASLRAGAGALAYALLFAATLGPVALAALGARTRLGGYLALLAVLALPEIAAPWTARLLPDGWRELTSIPAALDTVRAAFGPAAPPALSVARAAAALGLVIGASLLVIVLRVPGPDAEDAA